MNAMRIQDNPCSTIQKLQTQPGHKLDYGWEIVPQRKYVILKYIIAPTTDKLCR